MAPVKVDLSRKHTRTVASERIEVLLKPNLDHIQGTFY